MKYLEIINLLNYFHSSQVVLENVNCGGGGHQPWWQERSMLAFVGGTCWTETGSAKSILVPGYFVLLRRVAHCIGKVLGSGVRRSELQSWLHCLLDFLILASLWALVSSFGRLQTSCLAYLQELVWKTAQHCGWPHVVNCNHHTGILAQTSTSLTSLPALHFMILYMNGIHTLSSGTKNRAGGEESILPDYFLFLMLLLDTACNKNQQNTAQTSLLLSPREIWQNTLWLWM